MIEIRSFVVADSVAPMPDGKVMIIGAGIGRVRAQRFPWALAQLGVFVTVEYDDEPGTAHTLTADVIGPDDAVLASVSGQMVVEPNMSSANFAPTFAQLQIAVPGRHWVRILADDREVGRYPIDVEGDPQEPLFETPIRQREGV